MTDLEFTSLTQEGACRYIAADLNSILCTWQCSEVELRMLADAGVRIEELQIAVYKWDGLRKKPDHPWPYFRSIAWNEAVKRQQVLDEAGAEGARA